MNVEELKIDGTKLQILDAAERLFSVHGFEATSLRAITSAADVNLGAVNYHFTSKEALIVAVLKRRFKPLNDERLALLDRYEADAGGAPLPVHKILEALFRPALDLLSRPAEGGEFFLKLISQFLADPNNSLKSLVKEEFAESKRRFLEALSRALPSVTEEDIYWRMHFTMGAFIHTVSHGGLLETSSCGKYRITDTAETLVRIIDFCAAGFHSKNDTTGGDPR